MIERNEIFEQVVAQVQEDWRNIEAFEGGYIPPSGDYLCQLADLDGGADQTTDGDKYWWFKPVFTIVEGPLKDQTFRGERYHNQTPLSKRAIRTFADRVLGAENVPATDGELLDALEGAAKAGLLCVVRVGKRNWTSKKTGKSGTSISARILDVLRGEEEAEAGANA